MTIKNLEIRAKPFFGSNKMEFNGETYYVKSKGCSKEEVTNYIKIFSESSLSEMDNGKLKVRVSG